MRQYATALVDTTSDAMIALNQHFRIVAINPAVTNTFGWAAEDAIGRNCREVLKCQNLNHIELCGTSSCPLARVCQQKEALPNEELIIGNVEEGEGTPASTGRSCEVSVSVTPVDLGEDGCVVFTVRDVSTLTAANRVRSNFVSMVSHELRTPLNSVHGFVDLLLQGHMGELTEEQHKYLSYAQEGVQQLISMVEDILLITRSDSGQFEVKQQETNLLVLVRQVVSSLQIQARKAEVVLHADISSPAPRLYIDPQRMKQVLNNLVINAIKFTPPSGTVTIRALPYNDQFIMITVSDTGSGIPVEDRPHVFKRFYQSNHSSQSRVGGYGLGLTIAKLIVEQHGGCIDFDTVLGKGTTFYFTAPLYNK